MKNRILGIILLAVISMQTFAQLPYLIIDGGDTTIDEVKYNSYINNHPYRTREPLSNEEFKKIDKQDRPDLAYEHDWLMTHDPKDGKTHWERLVPVLKQMNSGSKGVQTVAPGGSAANKWTERGPNDVGGRVRAMMFDPTDNTNKKVFAGGVGGGLWYNTDITSGSSSWVAVNDFWANLAVSCIAYDPSSTSTFYIGTGEGFGNSDAIRGAGIWKSTNKGSTWTQLAASNTNSFVRIMDLAVTSTGRIIVAASGGLYTSDNGGTSFTRRQSSSYFADVEIAANGDLYAGTRYSGGLYKSTNNGTTWTLITNLGGSPDRIEIACAPSDSNTLYVVSSGGSGSVDVEWFKKSTNGGSSWTTLTIPKYTSNTALHFTRGQAWYDLILWVHPTNKNMVIAGGVDLHRTTNGGTSWSGVSYWNSASSLPYVHADQHAIVSRPGNNNEVIFGNDGGIFYSANVGNSSTTSPTFGHRVKNFNVTQFYAGAMHPSAGSNVLAAGAQDNGSMKLTTAGIGANTYLTGGDGAFCFIDQNNSNVFITSYVRNNWRRSTNSGSSFTYFPTDNTGSFINPADYDDNKNILYSARNTTTLKRIINMTGSYSAGTITLSGMSSMATHIRVSPYTTATTTLFVGSGGDVFKVTNANTTPTTTKKSSTSFPSGSISCIEIGANENELLVTFSNYGQTSIWYSSNGGTSWVSKEGNLPDMPVRWALFNPKDRKEVIVATELGVWATNDITVSSPTWAASSQGLANTRVDMLQYRSSDSLILAATHGRGAFTGRFKVPLSGAPVASFTASKDTICVGDSVTYTSTSTNSPTSLSWTILGGAPALGSGSPVTTSYSTAGLKSVTLIATNSNGTNSKTQSLVYVSSKPTASISSINQMCVSDPSKTLTQGSPSGGIYSGPGVSVGSFNPTSAGVGTHTIKYKITNSAGCSDSATTTVKVTNRPTVTAGSMSATCSNSPSITLSNGSPSGGTYSGNGVSTGVFSPSAAGAGTHTLKYLFGSPTCKDSATFTITVTAAPSVTLGAIGPYCTSSPKDTLIQGAPGAGGVYSGPGVSGNNFTPSSAGIGNHVIKYKVTNSSGCKDSASTTVSVSSGISVSVATVADQCSNSPSFSLTNGTPIGGTYSGTGVSGGIFNPASAGVGTHSIEYKKGVGTCKDSATFTIKVNTAPSATLSAFGPFCTTDPIQTLTQGSPSGGTYSGPGVSGNNFTPSSAGIGNHVIKYKVTNSSGCKDSASTTVSVSSGISVSVATVADQCSNSPSFSLTNGTPIGGTYSGTGVSGGIFNPASAGVGTHSIEYKKGVGTCKDSATFTIKVNTAPSATLSAFGPFCTTDPIQTLTQGSPSGGTYSGPGVTGNSFSPTSAGAGTHSIKYKVSNSNGCSDSVIVSVKVGNGITPTLTSFSNVCANASPFTLTGGLPTGGTYSGTGISSGIFSPAIAGSGIHTISYTHSTACVGIKATSTINVDSVPVVTLSKDTSVCLGSFVQLRVTGAKSYLWTPGFSLSDSTLANPLASPKVNTTYLVTGTNANGCPSSKTVKVVVNSTPTVNAGKNDTACAGIPFQLNATGALAYTWSPPAGLSNRNIANPTATITSAQNYTVMGFDANGCRDFDTILLEVTVAPTSSLDSFSDVCVKSGLVILTSGKPTGGVYSGTSVSGGNFNPKTAGIGTHTISYTVKVGTCSSTSIQTIKVISSPTIVWNTKLVFCENEIAITPIATPSGGAFSGNSLNNGKIDPGKLVAGRYTVTYTYSDSSGCSSIDSKEVVVNPNSSVDSIRGLFKAVVNRTYNYNLSAVNGSNYLWTVTGGKVLSSRSNLITVKWGKGPKGYLQVIQTNQFGCLDSTNAEVFLAPLSTEEMAYGGGELKLFPNPASDVLFVKLVNVSGVNNLIYNLVSMDGKIVKTGNLELEGGNKTFEIDLSEVSTGIYFFQTEDGENLIITPVVVNK